MNIIKNVNVNCIRFRNQKVSSSHFFSWINTLWFEILNVAYSSTSTSNQWKNIKDALYAYYIIISNNPWKKHLLTVDKISECWTLALELLAHSEDNWDDDVKDVPVDLKHTEQHK
jgi:hypothetical protein